MNGLQGFLATFLFSWYRYHLSFLIPFHFPSHLEYRYNPRGGRAILGASTLRHSKHKLEIEDLSQAQSAFYVRP